MIKSEINHVPIHMQVSKNLLLIVNWAFILKILSFFSEVLHALPPTQKKNFVLKISYSFL